jgi:hypothetical protein
MADTHLTIGCSHFFQPSCLGGDAANTRLHPAVAVVPGPISQVHININVCQSNLPSFCTAAAAHFPFCSCLNRKVGSRASLEVRLHTPQHTALLPPSLQQRSSNQFIYTLEQIAHSAGGSSFPSTYIPSCRRALSYTEVIFGTYLYFRTLRLHI